MAKLVSSTAFRSGNSECEEGLLQMLSQSGSLIYAMFVEQLQYFICVFSLDSQNRLIEDTDLSPVADEAFLLEIFTYLKCSANHTSAFDLSELLLKKCKQCKLT